MKVKMTLIATFAALLASTISSYAVQDGKLVMGMGVGKDTINSSALDDVSLGGKIGSYILLADARLKSLQRQ